MSRSTRRLTKHDGSAKDPTAGDHYGIIAIDRDGIEHHSAYSDFPHSIWLWKEILFWRYDDATTLEMAAWEIAGLRDDMK
jgi:hypothetical protein